MSAAKEIAIVKRTEEDARNASKEAGSPGAAGPGNTNGARAVDTNSPATVRRRLLRFTGGEERLLLSVYDLREREWLLLN